MIFIILIVFNFLFSSDLDILSWKLSYSLEKTSVIHEIPLWENSNEYTKMHFKLFKSPLQRIIIDLIPPKGYKYQKNLIPFAFRLIATFPDGDVIKVNFISHLTKYNSLYRNNFLVLSKRANYKIELISFDKIPKIKRILNYKDDGVPPKSIKLYFSNEISRKGIIENGKTCNNHKNSFFSIYGFTNPLLSRKLFKNCEDSKTIAIIDLKDWRRYYSSAYNLDKNLENYFVILRNSLEIQKKGRNVDHIKAFSVNDNSILITTATTSTFRRASDDWFLEITGENAVNKIKKTILLDLFYGKQIFEDLGNKIKVFSFGTKFLPYKKDISVYDENIYNSFELHNKEPYKSILSDIKKTKKQITMFGPLVPNIDGANYKILYPILEKLRQRKVNIEMFLNREEFKGDFKFNFLRKGINLIVPYYSFTNGRQRMIHARLLNIDSRVCYLITGTLLNKYSHEIGFRIQDTTICSKIDKHIKNTYYRTKLHMNINLIFSGLKKIFRINKIHEEKAQSFGYYVNGNLKKNLLN